MSYGEQPGRVGLATPRCRPARRSRRRCCRRGCGPGSRPSLAPPAADGSGALRFGHADRCRKEALDTDRGGAGCRPGPRRRGASPTIALRATATRPGRSRLYRPDDAVRLAVAVRDVERAVVDAGGAMVGPAAVDDVEAHGGPHLAHERLGAALREGVEEVSRRVCQDPDLRPPQAAVGSARRRHAVAMRPDSREDGGLPSSACITRNAPYSPRCQQGCANLAGACRSRRRDRCVPVPCDGTAGRARSRRHRRPRPLADPDHRPDAGRPGRRRRRWAHPRSRPSRAGSAPKPLEGERVALGIRLAVRDVVGGDEHGRRARCPTRRVARSRGRGCRRCTRAHRAERQRREQVACARQRARRRAASSSSSRSMSASASATSPRLDERRHRRPRRLAVARLDHRARVEAAGDGPGRPRRDDARVRVDKDPVAVEHDRRRLEHEDAHGRRPARIGPVS